MSFLDVAKEKYNKQDQYFKTFASKFLDVLYYDSRDFSNEQYKQFKLLIENFHKYISDGDKDALLSDALNNVKQLNGEYYDSFQRIFKSYLTNLSLRDVTIYMFCLLLINLAENTSNIKKNNNINSIHKKLNDFLNELENQLLKISSDHSDISGR